MTVMNRSGGQWLVDDAVKWASTKVSEKYVNTYQLPHDSRTASEGHVRFDVPVLYFLATPGVEPWWFPFREIDAWKGLRQPWGGKMPGGLNSFPANDVQFDPETGTKADIGDWCKDMVQPYDEVSRDGAAYQAVRVKTKVLTSAVVVSGQFNRGKDSRYDTSPGDVILLNLTVNQYRNICEFVEEKQEIDRGFSLRDYAVAIHQSGGGRSGKPLHFKMRLDKDTPPLEAFGESFSPVNAQDEVLRLRARAEKHLKGVLAEADPDAAMDAAADDEAAIAEEYAVSVADSGGSIDWETTGTPAIKQSLKAAGVVVPARATRDELVDLARTHLESAPY